MESDLLGIVAQFQKFPGKRLELFSVSTLRKTRHGYTSLDHYDVNHSKKYGYIYDMCGCGSAAIEVQGPYFLRGDVPIVETPCQLIDRREEPDFDGPLTAAIRELNRTRRLARLPRHFQGHGNLWEWLQREAIDSEVVYCSICGDHFPEEHVCEHCWWYEEACWWSTPSERCGCAVRDMCRGVPLTDEHAFDPARPRLVEPQWYEW